MDELVAGDLCLGGGGLRAMRVALSGQRIEVVARFLDDTVPEIHVRIVGLAPLHLS